MGSETDPEPPGEGHDAGATRPGRGRRPLAPSGAGGPGAERKLLILLILMLICAVLGLAAGIMVIVSRNAPGGGALAPGAFGPLFAMLA